MGNDRGQYGPGQSYGHPQGYPTAGPFVGIEPPKNLTPWIVGGVGVVLVGLIVLGSQAAAKQGPQLSSHDKEVRAWEAEFPGLPWAMDEVKTSDQMDSWERARDYWERKRG